jgi:hypothetical protein
LNVPAFEPRALSVEDTGRLPGVALELLRRSWLKLLGLLVSLAILGEWSNVEKGGAVSLLVTFATGGLIMALGFWTARAADRGESLLACGWPRVLRRGISLGLILGAAYIAWGLPTTVPLPASAEAASKVSGEPYTAPRRIATIPETLHFRGALEEGSFLGTGVAFARERAVWISIAAALGILLVVAAHLIGNGLAGGLVFVPLYVLGLSLPATIRTCAKAASRNRAFLKSIFQRSPIVVLGLNATVGLIVLSPDVIGLVAPLVTLYVTYVGVLSYVTYRAIFEGKLENSPRIAHARSLGRPGPHRPAAVRAEGSCALTSAL